MRLRRKRLLSVLQPGEVVPTMTAFPLMGVGDFVAAPNDESAGCHVRGPIANSDFVPDVIINPHPRFAALTKNIRVGRVLVMAFGALTLKMSVLFLAAVRLNSLNLLRLIASLVQFEQVDDR